MIKRVARIIFSEETRIDLYYLFFKIESYFYRGNNFYCVCCGKSFRKFLPYGNILRANAVCPYCRSLERTRLLMYYLQNETFIFTQQKKILHFAPERAISKKIKAFSKAGYISADINPALGDQIVDIQNIPFEKEVFDIVICSHVLGHIPDEAKAINEIFRVLKSGGVAIILTLIDLNNDVTYENKNVRTSEEKLNHYGESDLLRLHGNDFISRLQREGIKVERIDYSIFFTDKEKRRNQFGNTERELIFRCQKS